MRTLFAALVCSFGLLLVVHADQSRPTSDPCSEAVTTADMRRCQGERLRQVDNALNRAYQHLMGTLDASRQAKLRTAQRAWLAFRAAHAEFAASAAQGGSLAPVLRLHALSTLTEERVAQLTMALRAD